MVHKWDTVLEALPADRAWELAPAAEEEIREQGNVYSLHPQCPENVVYVGTSQGTGGNAYDYYRDGEGTYWYDSRAAHEPVAVRFRYGGGPEHREAVQNARAARGRYPWLQAWQGKRA